MKKTFLVVLVFVILLSLFTVNFVLADDAVTVEDNIAAETSENITEVIPITEETEILEIFNETEEIAPLRQATQQKYAGLLRISVGNGFAINSEKTQGERISAFWSSAKYISIDPVTLKNLTKQYKEQPTKLREEIAKLVTDKVVVKATGRFEMGFGRNKEKFKMLKKEFTNKSVSFYLLPINTNLAQLRDVSDTDIEAKSVGNLSLDAAKYPHLTVWTGKLTFKSGAYSGTWDVTAYSHSKTFTKSNLARIKETKEKIKEMKEQLQNKTISDLKQLEKRVSFWRRLMFWKRNV